MADTLLLKALRSRAKSLNLDNSHLSDLPPLLGQLDTLTSLSAKNNELRALPEQLAQLRKARVQLASLARHTITEELTFPVTQYLLSS